MLSKISKLVLAALTFVCGCTGTLFIVIGGMGALQKALTSKEVWDSLWAASCFMALSGFGIGSIVHK